MPYRPRYDKGDWKAICDSCGKELKASELRKRWDGFMVCAGDWEPRQPQDFVRGVADFQAPPFTRPEPADVFVPLNFSVVASDNASFTESNAKVVYKNITGALNNSAVNDQYINELALNASSISNDFPYESFSFNETVFVSVGRILSDSLSISESIVKQVGSVQSDSLTLNESTVFSVIKRPSDTLSVSESLVFNSSKVLTDSLLISESTNFYIDSPTVLNGSALNLLSIG